MREAPVIETPDNNEFTGAYSLGDPLFPMDTQIRPLVKSALQEDLPFGDATTDALIPSGVRGIARMVARETGIVAGLPVAEMVFREVDPELRFHLPVRDGARVEIGEELMVVRGEVRSLLAAERTALNFVQRASGIATATCGYVQRVAGTRARIVDTRKTVPGLRLLDKYAVRCGGGGNHRFSLSDGILAKDNHLAILGAIPGGWSAWVRSKLRSAPHTLRVEIEVDRLDQIEEAVQAGADIILLDNMDVPTLSRAVAQIAGRTLTEASGGVSLDSVRDIAQTGVDLISVGALTHSVRAMDVRLDVSLED